MNQYLKGGLLKRMDMVLGMKQIYELYPKTLFYAKTPKTQREYSLSLTRALLHLTQQVRARNTNDIHQKTTARCQAAQRFNFSAPRTPFSLQSCFFWAQYLAVFLRSLRPHP
jgi:hypothetical protein